MIQLVPDSLQYVPGIEFSCKSAFKKCHILGYGFDHTDVVLQNALNMGIELRQNKLVRRIAFLKERFNIELTPGELDWLYGLTSPGKPAFGELLVKRGLANSINDAITTYINPCKEQNDRIDSDMAIKGILHAGGIPIWAHPLGGEGEKRLTKDEFSKQLNILLDSGIRGLECFYSRYSQEDIDFLLEQARTHHLLISVGSDYHGKNKDNISLGKLNADNTVIDTSLLSIQEEIHFV